MVDPNGTVKKPGAKDLSVSRGEVLDVIELSNSKKALCRNMYGKCMYFLISLLSLYYDQCKCVKTEYFFLNDRWLRVKITSSSDVSYQFCSNRPAIELN